MLIILLISVVATAQNLDEDMLIQRFRKNNALDSLQGIPQKSASDLRKIIEMRKELVSIDNALLRNYISEGKVDSRKSRLRMLIQENNRLKEQYHSLRVGMSIVYIVAAVLLLVAVMMTVFFFRKRNQWNEEKVLREMYQQTIEETESQNQRQEDGANELVEELKHEVGSYKEELSKASLFLVELRNEKIKLENELEDTKEENANLKKEHNKIEKKLRSMEEAGNEAFDKLRKAKEEAEEKFNELFKQYDIVSKRYDQEKGRNTDYEERIRKEQNERQTVRQDLLNYIESKNEEIQQIKKSNVRKERELREIKEALQFLINDLGLMDSSLSKHIRFDMDDKDSITKGIRDMVKSKNDEMALIRKEKETLAEEKNALAMKIDILDRKLKTMDNELQDKSSMLSSEFQKRQALEQQLHEMLNHLKGL